MKRIRATFVITVREDYKEVEHGKIFLEDASGEIYRVPKDSILTEEFLPGYFMCTDEVPSEVEWVDSPEDFRVNSAVYRRVNVTFA